MDRERRRDRSTERHRDRSTERRERYGGDSRQGGERYDRREERYGGRDRGRDDPERPQRERPRERDERERDRSRERSREPGGEHKRYADGERRSQRRRSRSRSRSRGRAAARAERARLRELERLADEEDRRRELEEGEAVASGAAHNGSHYSRSRSREPPLPQSPIAGDAGDAIRDGSAGPADGGTEGGVDFNAAFTAAELQLMQAMGVPFGFDSTQGKHIEDLGANAGAVKIKSKRSARQYMNRRGGFNRPLPAEKTGERVRRD